MQLFDSPFSKEEKNSPRCQSNLQFLEGLEKEVLGHKVFDHPLLCKMAGGDIAEEAVKIILAQFSKHIFVFTGALCTLMGRLPDVRSRVVLFENLYEELGRGNVNFCHYNLYTTMLETLNIDTAYIENLPELNSIELLNSGLDHATKTSYITGMAWLGLGGEITIPNNFPYLRKSIELHFRDVEVDFRFFDHHGDTDQEHSDDANMLLAYYMRDEDRELIRNETYKSLSARCFVWDELLAWYM